MNIKKSVKQILKNPNIFCMDDCIDKSYCNKHMHNINYPNEEYLLAHMKDTPYCPLGNRYKEIME